MSEDKDLRQDGGLTYPAVFDGRVEQEDLEGRIGAGRNGRQPGQRYLFLLQESCWQC